MLRTCFVCVIIIICLYNVNCQLFEGSECFNDDEKLKGKCVPLNRCLSVVKDLKQRKNPQLCSFKGHDPIVCCTDCKLVDDVSQVVVDKNGSHYFKTGPKAYDKCLEYMATYDYPCSLSLGLKRQLDYLKKNCYMYAVPFIPTAVGGKNAAEGEFPHMALLGYSENVKTAQWLCGGSVISDKFILTAAHCIESNALGPVKYVALGILKRTDPTEKWQIYNVKRIIAHPQYNPPSKYHDIALLEVDRRIKFSRLVLPACLNTGGRIETVAEATGWGALGYRKTLADTLQVVRLREYTTEECSKAYPPYRLLENGYDNKTQSCYGDKTNVTDTCEGDSGGPLQINSKHGLCIYLIIGVTSYGRPCGVVGGAGMYTRVSYYVPWIESVVWP